MTTTLTGTWTGATRLAQASVKITIAGQTREIVGNSQYCSDNKLTDPVGVSVLSEALSGGTSGTITVSIA